MTRTEKTQILNILHYYRGLIGVDRERTIDLIKALDKVETLDIWSPHSEPIFLAIESVTGISKQEIRGRDRTTPVVKARTMAYVAFIAFGYMEQDASKLINKQRSGGTRRKITHKDYMKTDKEYEFQYKRIQLLLSNDPKQSSN